MKFKKNYYKNIHLLYSVSKNAIFFRNKNNYNFIVIPKEIKIKVNPKIKVIKLLSNNQKLLGTFNALINNLINGIKYFFYNKILIVGIGFKFIKHKNKLTISCGYSHNIDIIIPGYIDIKIHKEKTMILKCINKELLGNYYSKILKIKKRNIYKGKGIYLHNEKILIKKRKKSEEK
ncbi:hypothetical protein ACT2CR_00655 [Candidatus Vidania fulgoroideorum]